MTRKMLSRQILDAKSGETDETPDVPRPKDPQAREAGRFAEQTGGTHLVIDPKENKLVAFLKSGARALNDAQKSLTRNIDAAAKVLEDELGNALDHFDGALSPAAGGKPMVLKAQNDTPGAQMTDLAPAAGMESGVARMFFENAEERGAASAMGLQTVIMWQEPKTDHIHIVTSPEPLNTSEPRFRSAFPDRTEMSMMKGQQGPVAAMADISGGQQKSFQMSTPGAPNPLEDLMKAQLRKNKRKLADDEDDLKFMRPGA